MATTRRYINHLLQNTGITPACSEEERAAADDIARIFAQHGFEPEMQEFSASGSTKIVTAVLGIAAFLAAVLMGIGGALGIVGLLLALAAAVVFTMERMGHPLLSNLGAGGLSQNVIAYHQASGPLASPRNRPVVVVAHYDSPRADIFSRMPYASYRPLIVKLLPYAMLVPAIAAVLRIFPFPDAVKLVLWLVAIVAALVPLANAVAIIMNRFVLPYTSGSVCNKSSVAAMLGVMNAVAPFEGENEFPQDVPFDEYFSEQRRLAEEAERAAQEAAMAAAGRKGVPVVKPGAPVAEESAAAPAQAAGAPADAGSTAAMPSLDGAAAAAAGAAAGVATSAAAPADADATQAMAAEDLAAALDQPVEAVSDAVAAAAAVTDAAPMDEIAPVEDVDAAYVEDADGAIVEDVIADAETGEQVALPLDEAVEETAEGEAVEEPAAAEEEHAAPQYRFVNDEGNVRFGAEAIRALGMLPDSCEIDYEVPAPMVVEPPVASVAEDVEAAPVATAAAPETEPALTVEEAPAPAAPAAAAATTVAASAGEAAAAAAPAAPAPAAAANPDATVTMAPIADAAPMADADDADATVVAPALTDEQVAAAGQPYDDDFSDDPYESAFDEGYYPSYESEGLDFSADAEADGYHTAGQGAFAEALGAAGESIRHFFTNVVDRGKQAIEDFKASRAAAAAADEAYDEEGYEDDAAGEQEPAADAPQGASPIAVDETAAFDPFAVPDEVDATVAQSYDELTPAGDDDDDYDGDAEDDAAFIEDEDAVAADDESADEDDAFAHEDDLADEAASEDEADVESVAETEEATADELPVEEEDDAAARLDAEIDAVLAAPVPQQDDDPAATPAAPEAPASPAPESAHTQPARSVAAASVPVVDPDATVAQPRPVASPSAPQPAPRQTRPVETVDSLMAEINAAHPVQRTAAQPAAQRRTPMVVPDPAQPSVNQPSPSNRASLFDLPDPAVTPTDPFAPEDSSEFNALSADTPQAASVPPVSSNGFTVISSPGADAPTGGAGPEALGTISADAPISGGSQHQEEPKRHGIGGLFHRKKRTEQSMSDFLGVGDDFDAKSSGRSIGSWDNFEDDFDDDGWKGGATGVEGVSAAELRDAITSMGDDELLGHDIWFVATGASEYDQAGMRAFLQTHRDKLRGVFLINLECVGAGQVAMLATEGEKRVLKGDKRIMNLVRKVSSAFHNEYGAIEMPYVTTDAYAAMSMSLRSLTLAGIDGPRIACSHSEEDVAYNVDVENIDMVADVVTEVIRRS